MSCGEVTRCLSGRLSLLGHKQYLIHYTASIWRNYNSLEANNIIPYACIWLVGEEMYQVIFIYTGLLYGICLWTYYTIIHSIKQIYYKVDKHYASCHGYHERM